MYNRAKALYYLDIDWREKQNLLFPLIFLQWLTEYGKGREKERDKVPDGWWEKGPRENSRLYLLPALYEKLAIIFCSILPCLWENGNRNQKRMRREGHLEQVASHREQINVKQSQKKGK